MLLLGLALALYCNMFGYCGTLNQGRADWLMGAAALMLVATIPHQSVAFTVYDMVTEEAPLAVD